MDIGETQIKKFESKNNKYILKCFNKAILCFVIFIFITIIFAIFLLVFNKLLFKWSWVLMLCIIIFMAVFSIYLIIQFNHTFNKNNTFSIFYRLNKINKLFGIKSIKMFLNKYNNIKKFKILNKIRFNNLDLVLQGSGSILLNDKIFWRKINDIDLIFLNGIANIEQIRSKMNELKFNINVCENSYINFLTNVAGLEIEILPTKCISNEYVKKSGEIYYCNVYWQISMKLFQLMEFLVKKNERRINTIVDLIWLFSIHTKEFKNIDKINETLNYLVLSNYFVYYFFPYVKRYTLDINWISEQIKNVYYKNECLHNLNSEFFNFFTFEFLPMVFDKKILNKIKKIDSILKNRNPIWYEILDMSKNNELNSLKIVTNLKSNFWNTFDKHSLHVAANLNFNANDIRCYLLAKLNIKGDEKNDSWTTKWKQH
ncbi:hypothetical protein JPM7_2390 [Metamycoplasma equirhinis]|nr:hypothetical protein JPM7_2390 [Metamycoplasma equirhinis]